MGVDEEEIEEMIEGEEKKGVEDKEDMIEKKIEEEEVEEEKGERID